MDSTDGIKMAALIVLSSSQLAIMDGMKMLLLDLSNSMKIETGCTDLHLVFQPKS